MSTDKERELAEQAIERKTGRQMPKLGPSDTSDSGSDMPQNAPDTDSDSANTGERAAVENTLDDPAEDVAPDSIVDENHAGLAHTRPHPVRNGGR